WNPAALVLQVRVRVDQPGEHVLARRVDLHGPGLGLRPAIVTTAERNGIRRDQIGDRVAVHDNVEWALGGSPVAVLDDCVADDQSLRTRSTRGRWRRGLATCQGGRRGNEGARKEQDRSGAGAGAHDRREGGERSRPNLPPPRHPIKWGRGKLDPTGSSCPRPHLNQRIKLPRPRLIWRCRRGWSNPSAASPGGSCPP